MDKNKKLVKRIRDTAWEKASYSFYNSRDKQAEKNNNRLLFEKHEGVCRNIFGGDDMPLIDIQTFFAGINIQNVLGKNDFISIPDTSICINKNIIGISYKQHVLKVCDLTDLYRWSNIIKSIEYNLSEAERSIVNDYGNKLIIKKDLRSIYEWTVTALNTGIKPCKAMVINVLEKNSDRNSLFTRQVRGIKTVTSDSIYNGLVLQNRVLGETSVEHKYSALKWFKEKLHQDGFRSSSKHHPNIWSQYDFLCCLRMLDYDLSAEQKDSIITYLLSCQSPSGGFYSSIHGKGKTLLLTSAALISLKLLGFPLHGKFHLDEGSTSK